ncbi:MAG: proline racemase [Acidobacteria bacterium]|nr:MAG: proline racemase [Acidobacteriota bacterium]
MPRPPESTPRLASRLPAERLPPGWLAIDAVDAHAAGEPLRVVVGGFPELRGATVLARRRDARERYDHLRRALILEPRGHADMYGCLLTPPLSAGADLGVIFLHNEGYSTMCGHGIIGLATVLLETGMHPAREPETRLEIDAPAGRIRARARVSGGRVESVAFRNVPSFAVALGERVAVPGLGEVTYDLAFGGAFYAYVEAAAVGIDLEPASCSRLIDAGRAIKRAVAAARPILHPSEPELGFLYGVIFVGPAASKDAHSRNVCIFADGEVDRSPTGTGVSGRLAIHHARGELALEEPIVVESILGSRFTGRAVERTTCGPHDAIVPEIEGRAFLTGRHRFLIDPDDPLRHGFLLR